MRAIRFAYKRPVEKMYKLCDSFKIGFTIFKYGDTCEHTYILYLTFKKKNKTTKHSSINIQEKIYFLNVYVSTLKRI